MATAADKIGINISSTLAVL